MESNEQNKLTNKIERLIDTENRLTALIGEEGCIVQGGKTEVIKKKLIDTDNSMVITRGKGGWGR